MRYAEPDSIALKVVDGLTHRRVVDDLGFGDGAGGQRGSADLVDPARNSLGPVSDAAQGVIGEQGDTVLEPGDFEMVLDVGQGDVERERLDVTALGDPLGKGGVGGELEHTAQLGLSDQDQGGQGLAVELG